MRELAAWLLVIIGTGLSAGAVAAEDHVVSQKQLQFMVNDAKAAAMTVKAGDAIEFRNDDRTAHNVFSRTPGSEFDLGTLRRGASAKHTFTKAGTAVIECAIHPAMKLNVEVKP
jgi:plastocyanin